jgi:hypothetical protein
MKYYSQTQIHDLKAPLSQPNHNHSQLGLCLYSCVGSLVYQTIVGRLAEVRPVVDVSRPVSWVLRETIVLLELYIMSLGLANCIGGLLIFTPNRWLAN